MNQPSIVSILDFESWFFIRQKGSAPPDCGEDMQCSGALNMLCARNITGNANAAELSKWWSFEACLMENQDSIPRNAAACAKKASINPAALAACVSGALGRSLLSASAVLTAADNIGYTPWVIVEEKKLPPSDVGYVKAICDAFAAKGGSPLPTGCHVHPALAANVTAIVAGA
jgi:hypothetical protein